MAIRSAARKAKFEQWFVNTPLQRALQDRNFKEFMGFVEILDVNGTGAGGANVLHTFFKEFRTPISLEDPRTLKAFNLLIKKGVNIHAQDNLGQTPLHDAGATGSLLFVKTLIDKGADQKLANGAGLLPIHIAAMNGHGALCKLFVDSGVDADVLSADGRSPLFMAAGAGHSQACFDLIAAGADPELHCQGRTVWGHAGSKRQKETADDLRALMASRKALQAIDVAMARMRKPELLFI
jgi:ankyrin repeat protein